MIDDFPALFGPNTKVIGLIGINCGSLNALKFSSVIPVSMLKLIQYGTLTVFLRLVRDLCRPWHIVEPDKQGEEKNQWPNH